MRKWKKIYIIILLLITAVVFSYQELEVSETLARPTGVFSASFIQYWHSKDWDKPRWVKELLMLKEADVEELIVQYIADTKDRYAVYPTSIEDYEYNQVDMLDNLLSAADFVEIKVRIGLGFNNDWWIKNAMDLEWLMNEAEINKKIFNEVMDRYGHHPSLEGWYIPYEFYQFTAITKSYQKNLNKFLKEIAWEIKSKSDKDIMISPFYNGNYRWIMSLAGWRKLVENAMRNTRIDILALQDGVGVKNISIKQLNNLFAYTKKARTSWG